MAGQKITDYPNSVTALAAGDLFDVSQKISTAPDVYESRSLDWNVLSTIVSGLSVNIYNTDGSLTANRTVTMGGFGLRFNGGNIGVNTASTYRLTVAEDAASIATVITNTSVGIGTLIGIRVEVTGAENSENRGISAYAQNGIDKNTAIIGRAGITPTNAAPTGMAAGFFHSNIDAGKTGYGIHATADGAGTTNYGAYLSATGATNNYGLIVKDGYTGLNVGAPTATLHVQGLTSDNTTHSLLVENSAGDDLLLLRNDRYAQLNLDRIDVLGVAGNASLYMMSPTGTVDPTISFYHNGGTLSGYIGATNTNLNLDAVDNIFLKSSSVTVTTLKSTGFEFVSGKGIDTALTGGSDVLNIGATNADVINYGNASTVHNFLGTAIYELQVNAYVEDKLMTLNYGGASASAIGVGFEIQEDSLITGYIKTNAARTGFSILAPATSFAADLNFDILTANRAYQLPNSSGVLALTSNIPAFGTTAGTVAEGQYAIDARLTKVVVYQNTDSSHTGTTTETILYNLLIPAGTMGANDILWFDAQLYMVGVAGLKTYRAYFSPTSNNFGVGTFAATVQQAASVLSAGWMRRVANKGSVNVNNIHPVSSTTSANDYQASTIARTAINVNFGVDQYLIITGQLANSSDTIGLDNAQVYVNKA